MNGKMGLFKEGPYYKGDILLGVPKKILDVHDSLLGEIGICFKI